MSHLTPPQDGSYDPLCLADEKNETERAGFPMSQQGGGRVGTHSPVDPGSALQNSMEFSAPLPPGHCRPFHSSYNHNGWSFPNLDFQNASVQPFEEESCLFYFRSFIECILDTQPLSV